MSYLHCPTCQRAYNLAASPACPFCPVPATLVDAAEDIVAAAERLASAMARATPAERLAAAARMDRPALPDPRHSRNAIGGRGGPPQEPLLEVIRRALDPRPVPPPLPPLSPPPLLAAVISLVDRIAPRLPAPRLVRRAASLVRARLLAA